ncbi:hypothetical protein R6Q59_013778 [Mikania micrantha]
MIVRDEHDGRKDASFGSGSSSGITPKPGKRYEPSYSSINALVESCAKFSEANASPSVGDVGGMNLLASLAAGGDYNTHLVNMDIKEDKCVDDTSIENTVALPHSTATSVKPEAQINEESASWSSSQMHEDENKLAH